jgi:hypothetical protein
MAGADAYATNPAEAIRKLQRSGQDPLGDKCLLCGSADPIVYECTAICERSHVKRAADNENFIGWFFWLLLPALLKALVWVRHEVTDAVRQGHDVEVEFRLPVCDRCARSMGDVTRPDVVKKIISRVPPYYALLCYYPNLMLQIVRPMSSNDV